MKHYQKILGKNIKALHRKSKLSQKELAQRCGITQRMILNIEQGKVISSLDVLLAISDVFQLSLDNLLKHDTPVLSYKAEKLLEEVLAILSLMVQLAPSETSRHSDTFAIVPVNKQGKKVSYG